MASGRVTTSPMVFLQPFGSYVKKSSTFILKISKVEIAYPVNPEVYPHKTIFDRRAEEMKAFIEKNPVPKKFLKEVEFPEL